MRAVEIDHNFSKAHRIVTTSIIPIVERYAKESEAVWEGSKFWKQFFEASANVALSNYQEEEETYEETGVATNAETYITASSPGNYGEQSTRITQEDDPRHRGPEEDDDDYLLDDSLLESLNLTAGGLGGASTPKGKQPQRTETQWENIESPFDALRKELAGKDYTMHGSPTTANTAAAPAAGATGCEDSFGSDDADMTFEPTLLPATPQTSRRTRPAKGSFETPKSSPFYPSAAGKKTPGGANEDQLLHRVLDKNWRLQATPLGKPPPSRYRTIGAATATTPKAQILPPPGSESPMSSPPKPHFYSADIFSSPIPGFGGFDGGKKPKPSTTSNTTVLAGGPKTPTSRRYGTAKVTTTHHHELSQQGDDEDRFAYGYDDDDDSDDLDLPPGLSPPVTIQFSLPPSKLLATPAREASRRIVHDILQTAGAADESGATGGSSPPVVRDVGPLDDTF
ncbi:DASH complex subunit Ask1-domain-containing protein [Tuber indicum]|nr:DASH complex subunit Ask1-domain-containing protein [Tuber indicum]